MRHTMTSAKRGYSAGAARGSAIPLSAQIRRPSCRPPLSDGRYQGPCRGTAEYPPHGRRLERTGRRKLVPLPITYDGWVFSPPKEFNPDNVVAATAGLEHATGQVEAIRRRRSEDGVIFVRHPRQPDLV